MTAPALTRAELGARILRLSPEERSRATQLLALAQPALERPGAKSNASRDPRKRRWYAGRPQAYFADILGWRLTNQQDETLDILERETRVLIPSGNNLGKTFLLSGFGVYTMDARAALPDDEAGLPEQGARILLPGPDHDTVFETIYSEMLTHAARAESRGHLMPGERSDRSVLWRVRPKWHVEVLTPPQQVGQNVAHTASGRHHRNQIALIEEGQGVRESLWKAAEGMCSSAGNKIASSFNPTEAVGPAFQRSRAGAYRVTHLDAFRHPNVLERRLAIPDAVDFVVIDDRVRTDCVDRGPYPDTPLSPEHGDFAYALAPKGTDERGPREDGIPGHPDGEPRVYRPSAAFTAQVRGAWPSDSDGGLFSPGDWDAATKRWEASLDPDEPPDRVGIDPAREGSDDCTAMPSWGESAGALLRAYAEAQKAGPKAVQQLQQTRRVRSGQVRVLPKGKGPETARRLDTLFPDCPWVMDEGSVGSSPLDYATDVLGRDVAGVSFNEVPQERIPGEPWCENMRTQLYVRAAMLVSRGLADPPKSARLREEVLAHQVKHTSRTALVRVKGKRKPIKKRVPSVALISKDEVKKIIGRSPDESDAWVLSLFAPEVRRKRIRAFAAGAAPAGRERWQEEPEEEHDGGDEGGDEQEGEDDA